MKKKAIFSLLTLLYILWGSCYASEVSAEPEETPNPEEIMESQNEMIDYTSIQDSIKGSDVDFEELVTDFLKNDFKMNQKDIGDKIIDLLTLNIRDHIKGILKIILICLISALFRVFADSFENKQVVEVGNLIIFLLIIALSIDSFNTLYNTANALINDSITFIQALVPSLITVTVLSGASISSVVYSECILMLIGLIQNVIQSFLLPVLYGLLLFVVLNSLSDENTISKLIALIKKGYEWSIKILMWVFIGAFGLQSFGLPVVDGLVSRTAKQTLNIIPVVGTSLSQISDIVLSCGTIIKNAFGIGAIITIIFLTIGPIIKILVISLLYKCCAAICEPITESKIVNCLSGVGDVCFLLLGTVLVVVFLLISSIAITLYLTNMLLYIR